MSGVGDAGEEEDMRLLARYLDAQKTYYQNTDDCPQVKVSLAFQLGLTRALRIQPILVAHTL